MRRGILVFFDRLRFRDYRRRIGNFEFTVKTSHIVVGVFAVLAFFFSVIPASHLLTLEHLIQEKELRNTQLQNQNVQLQNQIVAAQGELAELNEAIAERDTSMKTDDTTFEYLMRVQFAQELVKLRQEYFDSSFGKIQEDPSFLKNPGPRLNEINSITLDSYYQDYFLKKTEYGYAHFVVLRPIFLDMRQSFSSFLKNPPPDYSNSCFIKQREDGKYYLEVQGKYLPSEMRIQGYDKPIQPFKVVDARRYCLSQSFGDLVEKWAEDRGAVKGPWGIPTKSGWVIGPRP